MAKSSNPTIKSKQVTVDLPVIEDGGVGTSVAYAHASANPKSWADKYTFDFDTMSVKPRALGAHVPQSFAYAAFTKMQDGSVSASIPSLAVAARPSYYNFGSNDFDLQFFANWDSMSSSTDAKCDIRKAIKWWRTDPLVFNCVGFLSNMSNAIFTIQCDNEEHRRIVENWMKEAMPFEFRQQWFLEYFRTAMVPVLKTLVKYRPKALRDNKIPTTDSGNIEGRAVAADSPTEIATKALLDQHSEAEKKYKQALAAYENAKISYSAGICKPERLEQMRLAVAATQYEWVKGMIPGAYTILDPLLVDMEGPEEMGLLRQPYLKITNELQEAVNDPSPEIKPILASIPAEIIEQIRNGRDKVWLSPNICNMTFGDKQPYERYPTPMAVHAFTALEMKAELTAMDLATSRHVKNRILLVKVGNDEYPEFDTAKIAAIQAMFNTPGKNMTFVWNHCIELEWVEPNLDSLKDTEKYKFWNSEIRTVYGISPVLTGTSETSGSIGNSMMNFKGVEERVEEAQGKFLEFFNREVKMLKAALGISSDISASFDKLNSKEELKYWTVLTQAVMNGILDHQTMLETLNFKFPIIKERMAKMKELQKKGLFVPMPSANNMGPDGQPAQKGAQGLKKKKKPGTGGVGGKPANNPGAKNNSTRTGQSTPKRVKATAKIQTMNDGRFAIVVEDMPGLTEDHYRDVAEQFNVPADYVMAKAEYESKYGEIDMSPVWPTLKPVEMIGVVMKSTALSKDINEKVEKAVAEYKKEIAGKRSKYLTDKVKVDISTKATSSVLEEYRKSQDVGEIPKAWGRYVEQSIGEMTDSYANELPADAIGVAAWVMTTARLKKLRDANKALKETVT